MSEIWTSTDCLALDVEMVEKWVCEVVRDRDEPGPQLVSLVARLRTSADILADYLFRASEPAGGSGSGCGSAAPHRADAGAEVRGKRRDSGGRPEGVPNRERADASADLGQPSKPTRHGLSALHE